MTERTDVSSAAREMEEVAKRARIFVSMPLIEGVTPKLLFDENRSEAAETDEPVARRHGVFAADEIGVPFFDHSLLYGDGCFEGILIRKRSIFLFREHMLRWWRSAERLSIPFPYSLQELGTLIWKTAREVGFRKHETGYLRPVLTRGIGDLGINPRKCVAGTIFTIASKIRLYPEEKYESGIGLGLTRGHRRPSGRFIDPAIKSNNYLNNVLGLLEGTSDTSYVESLMLTKDGHVAEATVDNVFQVLREEGWREIPSKVCIRTPVDTYCLGGITRGSILKLAKQEGYRVEEPADMLPVDLIGPDRECFITGTGAGIMPIVELIGRPIGDGTPGPITKLLRGRMQNAMEDPDWGLSLDASEEEAHAYLSGAAVRAALGSTT